MCDLTKCKFKHGMLSTSFDCKFCKKSFCLKHRLPEDHACTELGNAEPKILSVGPIFTKKEKLSLMT